MGFLTRKKSTSRSSFTTTEEDTPMFKPNDSATFMGSKVEVMSHPYPEDDVTKILIRKTPGDPTTLMPVLEVDLRQWRQTFNIHRFSLTVHYTQGGVKRQEVLRFEDPPTMYPEDESLEEAMHTQIAMWADHESEERDDPIENVLLYHVGVAIRPTRIQL